MTFDQDRTVAVCPLIFDGREEFACPGPALAGDLSSRARLDVLEAVLGHVDDLAAANAARRVAFRGTPLAPRVSMYNELLRFGFLDVSLPTQVIKLADEATMWRGIRHGHQADIRKGQRVLKVRVVTADNYSPDLFETYVTLHRKAAGRVTRPRRTFDLMAEWISAGAAALFVAEYDGRPAGTDYVNLYKDGAYYSSAANDPNLPKLPIGHVLQWEILKWLAARGIKRYEVGIQSFTPSLHQEVTQKEADISRFKRGFGGETVVMPVAEKFYDPTYFAKVQTNRVELYAKHLREQGRSVPKT
jgi:hypothetical protein